MVDFTWIALAAFVTGAAVRALKDDVLGAVLTRFFRPDGPPIVVPKRLLPWLALGFGALAAVLDAKNLGSTWEDAAKAGVMAAALAVFGHDLLKGLPGANKLVGLALVILPLSLTTACRPAATPREQARSVVLTIAEGTRVADETCAAIARSTRSLPLATTCADAVDEAREALIAAEDGIDAWEAAGAENVPCAVRSASAALGRVLDAVRRAGGTVPPTIEDALRLAPLVAGGCRG